MLINHTTLYNVTGNIPFESKSIQGAEFLFTSDLADARITVAKVVVIPPNLNEVETIMDKKRFCWYSTRYIKVGHITPALSRTVC